MLRNGLLLFALGLSVFGATPARSQEANRIETGNDLLRLCESDDPTLVVFCIGFITGVEQTLDTGFIEQDRELSYCRPPSSTYGQMQDTVVASLRANPNIRHNRAAVVTAAALFAAYPCPQP